MPSRALLARRLHRSVDTVDRAMRELVAAGIVRVEHRHDGLQHLTNRFTKQQGAPVHYVSDESAPAAAVRQ
jgi:DNA-binding transcriptional regulator YhcF (GntR family)